VLYVAITGLIGLWSQQRWAGLVVACLGLGWQQLSRGAAEWWDSAPLPGKASAEAERLAGLLVEESRAPGGPEMRRGLDKDYRGLEGRLRWQSPEVRGAVVDLHVSHGVVLAGRPRIWGSIEVLSSDDGQHLRRCGSDEGMTGRFAVSPETARLAIAMEDGALAIWDADGGQELLRWPAHQGTVTAVAFSPDGRLLASGSEDRKVRLWNPTTGELVRELGGHEGRISDCAFHPSGSRLISASWDGTIAVWDLTTGTRLTSLRAPRRLGYSNCAFASQYSPDGMVILGRGSAGRIRLWDAITFATLLTIPSDNDGRGFATDPSGSMLAVPGKHNSIRIVALRDGMELARAALPDRVNSLVWHPSGSTVLVGTTSVHAIAFPGLRSDLHFVEQ
jgi:hypothetical protein